MAPIVIRVPGVRLLSTKLSKNARIHPQAKARITRLHRQGTNGVVSRRLAEVPGYMPVMRGHYKDWKPIWVVTPKFPVRLITLTRVAPARYPADGDNLITLLSSVRDGIADTLGGDDSKFHTVSKGGEIPVGHIGITYEQVDGPWSVVITIEPA